MKATLADAGDHLLDLLGDYFVHGDVVEEEHGFSPLDEEVVDAHGDEVDADGVVFFGLGGDWDVGSAAVTACGEDGVSVVFFYGFFMCFLINSSKFNS